MSRVAFEKFEVFIRKALNGLGQPARVLPESGTRKMFQSPVQRPALKSASVSATGWASLPAFTSVANCWSHASASNSRNQSRNAANSFGGSFFHRMFDFLHGAHGADDSRGVRPGKRALVRIGRTPAVGRSLASAPVAARSARCALASERPTKAGAMHPDSEMRPSLGSRAAYEGSPPVPTVVVRSRTRQGLQRLGIR